MKTNKPHPLEEIALKAFAENDYHAASLGYFLAGSSVRGAGRAYDIVAKDVLGYMESQGKLKREGGYYRLLGVDIAPRADSMAWS
jgi:hypothetical protein